jgi:pyrroloquinoline quinone biosynthesis protein B
MIVQILGSGAGGGLPQWNCACRQCDAARSGLLETRTQCSVAVSADRCRWILVNASPDLRSQLIRWEWQLPSARGSPVGAVLLTDADLDHTLGLYLMRENESPISIHASEAVQEAVEEGLRLTEVLNRYCGVQWVTAPLSFRPLLYRDGEESGLEYKAVEIEGPGPRYRRRGHHHSCRVFYVLREPATAKAVLVAPAVAKLELQLLRESSQAEAILFDGTFWSDDDFERSGVASQSAGELLRSHLPILSGSLKTLTAQRARHKIYLHVNNTNPVLWSSGPERKLLDESGIQVATDGMTIEL